MKEQDILNKYFTEREQLIFNRTQIKIKNTFPVIWKDLWVSKQYIAKTYNNIKSKYDKLYLKLKDYEMK